MVISKRPSNNKWFDIVDTGFGKLSPTIPSRVWAIDAPSAVRQWFRYVCLHTPVGVDHALDMERSFPSRHNDHQERMEVASEELRVALQQRYGTTMDAHDIDAYVARWKQPFLSLAAQDFGVSLLGWLLKVRIQQRDTGHVEGFMVSFHSIKSPSLQQVANQEVVMCSYCRARLLVSK